MRVLAVIPARGGSKRLPMKNVLTIAGRPLLAWSINAAKASTFVDRIVVSSDHDMVLQVARQYGADIVRRPDALATDEATLDATVAHAVKTLRERDGYQPEVVVTLQPTVPERRPGLIDDCIRHLFDTDADSVFTARPIQNCWWREDPGGWVEHAQWVTNNPRRLQAHEIPSSALRWEQDGSVRVTRADLLDMFDPRNVRPPRLIGGHVQPFPNERTEDIDTRIDFVKAEAGLLYMEERQGAA